MQLKITVAVDKIKSGKERKKQTINERKEKQERKTLKKWKKQKRNARRESNKKKW